MKLALFLLLAAAATAAAVPLPPGAALVRTIEWKTETLPPGAVAQPAGGPDGAGFVTVSVAGISPAASPLWTANAPGIHAKCYALLGKVRYRDVAGAGYFNLWNEFGGQEPTSPRNSYFSRTLAETGPLAKLTGSSDWRPLMIPFDASQAKAPPTRLELGLVLAGKGTVDVSDLQLVEFADAGAMWGALGTAGGGGGGWPALVHLWVKVAALGVTGAVLLLAGLSVWRRRQREVRRMRAMDAG